MAFEVRRVVTGHDETGKAIVEVNELSKNVVSRRPGVTGCVVWTTQGFPVDNTGDDDEALREVGTTLANGTVFRILQIEPGSSPRNHRTDSIDYAIIISGEIDMEIDGDVVHLRQGDTLVQRGTIHNWANNGTEPCVIAFILIDAKPVEVAGKVLHAVG